MNDITPNSHRYKEEQKQKAPTLPAADVKVKKVVTGNVNTKKKNNVNRLVADDLNDIKDHIIQDVLVPTAKDTVWDIVTRILEAFLYNGNKKANRFGSSSGSKVLYTSYFDRARRSVASEPRRGNRFDIEEDLVFERKVDANNVLREMHETIGHYGFVTVANMYDMADKTAPYTTERYGWTSIRSAEVIHVRNGYIIKLPNPMVID